MAQAYTSAENLKNILLDQHFFSVNEETYKALMEALDSPPVETQKLKKLLTQKAPWDK